MVDLSLVLGDADLRRRFGAGTCDRAAGYVAGARVLSVAHQVDEDGDLVVRGQVVGSRGAAYSVFVSVAYDVNGLSTFSRCSCPMIDSCKHVVALLLTVRAEQEADSGSGPGSRRWERRLASVLDELDQRAGTVRESRPLALQVEVRRTPGPRWSGFSASPAGTTHGTLRLRPMQRGARDNWVRTGVGWSDVLSLEQRNDLDPAQVAVLGELYAAYRAATRSTYGTETHLPLASFGVSLWHLLDRATATGMPLLAGDGLAEVVVADPLTVELDVNTGADHTAHLAVGVRHDGEWYGTADVDVLGSSGHGVALWAPDDGDGQRLVLAPLTRPAGPEVRRLIAAGDELVVPAGDREELVTEYLPRLQRHVPVVSSDGSVRLPEPARPRLVLAVTWAAVDEVRTAWSFHYRVGEDDRVYGIDEERGLRGVRHPTEEQALLAGLELDEDQVRHLCRSRSRERGLIAEQVFRGTAAIAFAEDVLPTLEHSGQVEIEEVGGRPDYREATGTPEIRFATRGDLDEDDSRTDWLDLEVIVSVDGHFIALSELLAALTLGQDRMILTGGVHIRLDRPEFERLAELVRAAREMVEQPPDRVRLGHHDLGLWDELAEVGLVDAQAAQWVHAAQALRRLDTLPEVQPTGLKAELRHYQLEGFRWLAFLWQSGLGGILADDMGLGKTLQTLALVAHARERGAAPFLVVAPTSVVGAWAGEAAEFTPGLVVRTVTESHSRRGKSIADLAQDVDVVVTSYTLYRLEVDAYREVRWGGLVLDEAQTVKNHLGKTYQCVRRLDVPFRLALTGTPMENRLLELWSLLSVVAPGLYPYPQRFVELVANPVERLGDTAVLERFRRRIRPFLLRRTKDLVAADLPPKQEQVLDVRLTPRHRKVYDTHLQRERQHVLGLVAEDFDRNRIAIFRSLTRLRQLSLDAALVDEEYDGIGSAKIDILVDHLLEVTAEGHRALVFSQFTSFLRRVRARLDREGIASTYLDGRTRRRAEVVDGFKKGDASVFLISLKAGGTGLTLTEADYVFVLDPWWNPAVEAQAVDRAHRIGQQRPVMVYRLVSTATIEEKVMALKARKAALFSQVVDGGGGAGTPIDADDVRALFDE